MTKAKKTTEVASETEVQVETKEAFAAPAPLEPNNLPVVAAEQSDMDELFANQGAGLENVDLKNVQWPFLYIIQANSPQRKKDKPEYITGAEEGMIFNNTTKQIYDGNDGLVFVPIYHEVRYIARTPKDPAKPQDQPKFVRDYGAYKLQTAAIQANGFKQLDKFNYTDKEGNTVTPIDYIYMLVIDAANDKIERAAISFKSTLAQQAREIVQSTLANTQKHVKKGFFVPPLFWKKWMIKTAPKSNGSNSWFIYSARGLDNLVKCDPAGGDDLLDNITGGKEIYLQAKKIYNDWFKGSEGNHGIDISSDLENVHDVTPNAADKTF